MSDQEEFEDLSSTQCRVLLRGIRMITDSWRERLERDDVGLQATVLHMSAIEIEAMLDGYSAPSFKTYRCECGETVGYGQCHTHKTKDAL